MALFAQFLLRLTCGLALCMATVSHRQVASGYFRNHLYVTLGAAAMAALLLSSLGSWGLALAIAAAVASYAGAVCWLYEMPRAGKTMLVAVAVAAYLAAARADGFQTTLTAAYQTAATAAGPDGVVDAAAASPPHALTYRAVARLGSAVLLGAVTAAMLLGHWYLNAPGMQLEPLRGLLSCIRWAVVVQACVAAAALAAVGAWGGHGWPDTPGWAMIAGRWLFGLAGVAILEWMARKTLEIPNTQSATGILYVSVIGAFAGEMLSLMLAAEYAYPL